MKRIKEIAEIIINKISAKSKLGKKLLLTVALLVSGAMLLLFSEAETAVNKSENSTVTETITQSTNDYVQSLENRLVSIISSIEGAGATKVMVTLESGNEEVYLHNYDYGENVDPEGKNSLERKDEYVIVDGDEGEKGIVVRVAEPRVRGVAVVCEGGGSDVVREQIISAVTALLDVSSARVSVSKMN